jgi:hypothetical protein
MIPERGQFRRPLVSELFALPRALMRCGPEWRPDSHLWNRYAEENGLLRISGIYERILAARAGFVDVAQRYRAATTSQDRPIRQTSAIEE